MRGWLLRPARGASHSAASCTTQVLKSYVRVVQDCNLQFWCHDLPPSRAAVCGCGLDTVPVRGATLQQAETEREALLDATAALLLDVAAMAHRLDKPLSVRLLPVPGAAPGQLTAFDSPYLLNCCVLPIR